VAPVVAAARVVGELGAEHGGDGGVFGKGAVLAVGAVGGERGGSDVFGDPEGVAGAPVEGGGEGGGRAEVGDGAGEAVFEEAVGVDGGVDGVVESSCGNGFAHLRSGLCRRRGGPGAYCCRRDGTFLSCLEKDSCCCCSHGGAGGGNDDDECVQRHIWSNFSALPGLATFGYP